MTATLHQLVPNFAAGDAIGMHVRHSQAALRAAGFRSEIFYDDAQAAVRRLGRHYSSFDPERDGDGGRARLLFQLSTGSPMTSFLLGSGLPFGVYFHNITPPRFFDRWEPGAAENLRRALEDMRRLAPRAEFAIANSSFSERELREAGFSPTAVVPVLVAPEEEASRPNERLLRRLRAETAGGGRRWLFVSRVAPNKCQHDLVAAFAVYRLVHDPAARLTIVGGRTSSLYYRSLELLCEELGVAGAVELTDTLSEPEKLACLSAADVFVSLSEHEGFGVGLLEAMRFDLPVVAFAGGAVAETVGDAGLLLDDKDPAVVAAAVHRVLTDGALREELVAAGRRRVEELHVERTSAQLVEAIRSFVGLPVHA